MNKLLKILSEEIKSTLLLERAPSPVQSPRITSHYGTRWGRMHHGIDLAVAVGTPILSPYDGTIIDAKFKKGSCGGTIYVKHDNGLKTRYCHCSKIDVIKGQQVSKGEKLGETGGKVGAFGSGNSQGPHLHFEVYKNSKTVDPIKYFDFSTNFMTSLPPSIMDLLNFNEKSLVDDSDDVLDFIESSSNDIKIEDILNNQDNRELIIKGIHGEGVKEFQEILVSLGYDLGEFGPNKDGVDGKFGPKTKKAVKEFQKDHGLKVDGIIGIETATALSKYLFSMKNI